VYLSSTEFRFICPPNSIGFKICFSLSIGLKFSYELKIFAAFESLVLMLAYTSLIFSLIKLILGIGFLNKI